MENTQQYLFPTIHRTVDCFIQENDKYGRVIQIPDFRSPHGVEVSAPERAGSKMVVVVLILYSLGAYLVPGSILNTLY